MAVRVLLLLIVIANILVLVLSTDDHSDNEGALEKTSKGHGHSPYSSPSGRRQGHSKTKSRRCRRGSKCKKGEEFSACVQSIGRPQYCSENNQKISTTETNEASCRKGCVCKVDYLRAENGTCIPKDQCEVKCGDNEVLNNCPGACDSDYCPKKENENADCVGPAVCLKPACTCAFNHRRAENGTCIPTKSCPPFDCSARPNEEFNPCPPLCPTDDCSQASPTGRCPRLLGRIGIVLTCNPKCRCIKGYWRKNGTCVPYGQCPGVCPANERYSECIQGECIALNCDQKDQSIPCPRIKPENCLKGCVCEENYLRAANGTCVPQDQCEINACPIHEEYVACVQGVCRAMNCSEKGNVCPPNEQWSECKQARCRAENCTQRGKPIACPGIAEGDCIEGCVCQENYLRDANGVCVPEDQCPGEVKCGDNEVLNNCPGPCDSDYCPKKENENADCVGAAVCLKPACECAFNHRRADNGTCIPTTSCPPFDCSARPNEEFNPCPPLCPTDDCSQASPSGKCPLFGRIGIVLPCDPTCRCIKGYWRNNGTCVPYGQCPGVCPANERYSECIQGECIALNCDQKDQSIPCPRIKPENCLKGCVCEENYLRAANGTCVLKDQCESNVCPPNEQWSECTQARCRAENCAQRGKPIACAIIAEGGCIEGCVCQDNYLRDENGVCVPEDQCPGEVKCGDNEVLNNCPGSCDSDYCPKKENENADCVGAAVCLKPACECAFNHRRADNGTCIPTTSCPPFDCSARPNEEFNPCPPLCPTDDCSQASPTGKCPLFGRIGIVLPCDPTCRCIKGYWRNNGTCVPYGQCPGVCPANERYSECIQGECIALNCDQKDQSIPCPRIKPENCLKGCVCEENYLRAVNGKCVPKDQCETDVCPPNEIWGDCTQQECRAQLCFQRGIPVPCPGHVAGRYTEGCVCQEKYIRDETGVCIPADQYYAGLCSVNEEYTTCTQAVRRPTNCSQRRHEVDYSDIYEPCEDGCVCKEKFLRNAEGNCVPEDKCGNITCFENEVLDPCSQDCISDYCSSLPDLEEHCYKPETCKPQCKCRLNYRRSYNGTCIETRDCPPFDCTDRPNEEYNSCPAYCPTDECSLARVKGECPFKIGVVLECQPQCQCIEGYGRVNGTCVPYEECPDLCPINEEYSSCVQATCRAQNCTDRDALLPCPAFGAASCKKGCICKKNYYRNEIGKCVSYEQCAGPICPDENEEYTSTKRGCPPNTCVSLVARFKCDENQKVEPGCVCQSGYLRLNETSPCIPICQCPQMANSFDCIGKHSNNYTLIGDEAKTISEE